MCAFSLAMSVSPGPVNLITLAIGVNRGLREAIPFVSGATIGFTLLLMLVGLGLGELAVRFSPLLNGTNYVGAAIIFFMGYKIVKRYFTTLDETAYQDFVWFKLLYTSYH